MTGVQTCALPISEHQQNHDQEATYNFPAGYHIVFFIAPYQPYNPNDYSNHNGEYNVGEYNYSLPELNKRIYAYYAGNIHTDGNTDSPTYDFPAGYHIVFFIAPLYGQYSDYNPGDYNYSLPELNKRLGILFCGIVFFLVMFALLVYCERRGKGGVDVHELTMFFTTFVMIQFWNLFNAKALMSHHTAFRHFLKDKGMILVLKKLKK